LVTGKKEIELPAVIDMVRLAADDVITAGDLVRHLEALAEMVRAEYDGPDSPEDEGDNDAWGADCPATDCKVCDAAREDSTRSRPRPSCRKERLQPDLARNLIKGCLDETGLTLTTPR
jgi:hypothetical protein